MSILLISSGGPNLGFGHIRRSLVFIEYLKSKGYQPQHLVLNDINSMISNFNLSSKLDLKLLIIDSPLDCSELVLIARKSNIKTLTLDGNCRIGADFDISLDPRNKICDEISQFSGFQYTIISKKISRYRKNFKLKNISNTKKVTVAIGGGDVLNKGIATASYLAENGFEVSIIKGPYAKYKVSDDRKFLLIDKPRNIGKIISDSDWMVTNGGHTLFESMSLGKPCFVIPQTDRERNLARYFFKNELILGYADSLKTKNLVLPNKVCSGNAFSYIDGRGSSRIFKILEAIIEK